MEERPSSQEPSRKNSLGSGALVPEPAHTARQQLHPLPPTGAG